MRALKIWMFSVASLLLLLLCAACTRPQGDKSKVNLTIPLSSGKSASQSVSAQSSTLNYVAINVTGPSLDPLFCSWDLESNRVSGPCSFTQIPPTDTLPARANVSLPELLNGSGRTFQALMVFSEGSGNSMTFQYGTDTKDLPQAEVSLKLGPVGGGAQYGGHVSGRYLTDVNAGPSGLMNIRFSPGAGPSMVVQQVEMYSGWFQAFTLEKTGLEYIINGENIFDRTMTKADFVQRSTDSGHASRVNPEAIGVGDYSVFGFFTKTAANLTGKTTSLSSCTLATAFTSCFSNDLKFAGPFRGNSMGDLLMVSGLTPATISWTLLPGVSSNDFADSVAVYTATTDFTISQLNNYVMSRGFNCAGFALDPNVQLLGVTTLDSAPQLVAGLGAMPSPTRPLAVCPKKDLNLLTAAAVLPHLNNDGGCADCKYLRIEVISYAQSNGDKYELGKNGCYPIQVKAFRGQGTSSSDHTHSISMTLADPSWGHYYSDSVCSAQVGAPTLSLSAGSASSGETYWVKSTAPGTNYEMAATISSDPSDGVISYQSKHNMVDVLNPVTKIQSPAGNLLAGACFQGSVEVSLPNGMQIPMGAGTIYDNLTSTAGLYFGNTAAACAGSVSNDITQSMGSSPIHSSFWFRIPAASTQTVTASPTSFDASSASIAATASAISNPVSVRITPVSTPLVVGKCNELNADLVNSAGVVVPALSNLPFALSQPDNIGYWSDQADCHFPTTGYMINQGESSHRLFFFVNSMIGGSNLNIIAAPGSNLGIIGADLNPAIALPANGDPWIKVISRPNFPKGNGVIGSHNFPVAVRVEVPTGMTVKCYKGPSDLPADDPSWGDCATRLSALSTTTYEVSFTPSQLSPSSSEDIHLLATTGKAWTTMVLSKSNLFGSGSFNVQTCDVVAAAGATFDAINIALGSHPVVCLDAGTFSKGADTANSISMPPGTSVLGKVDVTTGLAGSVLVNTAGFPVFDLNTFSGTLYISNLQIQMSGAGVARKGIDAANGAGTLYSFGNIFDGSTTSGGSTIGISMLGSTAQNLYSAGDVFNIKAVSTGGVSAGISSQPGSSFFSVSGSKFNLVSVGVSDGSIGISIDATSAVSTATFSVMGSSFQGSGGGIRIVGNSASTSNDYINLSVDHSLMDFNSGASSFSQAYPIFMQDNVGLSLSESVLNVASGALPAIKHFTSTAAGRYDGPGSNFMMLKRNVIRVAGTGNALYVGSATIDLASTRQITVQGNHFVRMTGGGNTAPAVAGNTSTYPIAFIHDGSAGSDGDNRACGVSGNDQWSATYSGTSSIASGGFQWSYPSVGVGPLAPTNMCPN